jgi:hypothetical protein
VQEILKKVFAHNEALCLLDMQQEKINVRTFDELDKLCLVDCSCRLEFVVANDGIATTSTGSTKHYTYCAYRWRRCNALKACVW